MRRVSGEPEGNQSEQPTGTSLLEDTESLGPDERVAPTWTEPLVRSLSRPFGGPLGRHASVGRQWFWTAARVILLLAVVVLALGWLQKSPCIQTYKDDKGVLQLDWSGNRQYVAMCYSDIVPLYTAERLDQPDTFPYKTSWIDGQGTPSAHIRYMEYPVLTGVFQWFNAKLAQGYIAIASSGVLPFTMTVVAYFDFIAFFLSLAWLVVVWSVMRIAGRRMWDAALVAVSPLVIVQAFTNFDTIAVAFATAGLLAWAKKKPVLAGILLGLGGAAKLYPLFLLGPLLLLCWRGGRMKVGWTTTASALITWVAVNAPIYIMYRPGWWEFFRLNTERGVDPDSLYNVVQYFTGWTGFDGILAQNQVPTILNTVSAVLFILCCIGITWVTMSAPTRPRLAQICLLVVAAFLLTNKVWSPQYSLWLVPLAVLAVPRWRPLLAWMTIDALVWVPRMFFYLGTDKKGLPAGPFLTFVCLRDLAVIGLCVLVIREIYRPEHDLVRRTGDDDPMGGFLDGAPDKFTFGRRQRLMTASVS
jgi:uncharacterized membrane protein